jgi:hypothetical protein
LNTVMALTKIFLRVFFHICFSDFPNPSQSPFPSSSPKRVQTTFLLGKDFEKGLENLKNRCEKTP